MKIKRRSGDTCVEEKNTIEKRKEKKKKKRIDGKMKERRKNKIKK